MRNAILVTCVALLFLAPALRAADPAPEDVFKGNGLTKVGAYLLLDGDIKLPEGLRAVRLAKKDLDEYTRSKTATDRAIQTAKDSIAQWQREYDDLHVMIAQKHDVYHHNQVVAEINARVANMREAARFIDEQERQAQKRVDPRNIYAGALVDLSDAVETTAKQYENLLKNAQLQAALTRFNEKAIPKVRLGPSSNFAHELTVIRQERSLINTGVIKFEPGYSTPAVQVTLNNQLTQTMIVDSGASLVSLSWETARKLDLTPSANDKKVPIILADGKAVQCAIMTLKSVRVGVFKVENVPCVILPKSVKGSELLGVTFLRNFRYQMDLAAGEMHMSQLVARGDPTTLPSARVVVSTPSPTTAPSSAPPAPAPTQITVAATHPETDPVPTQLHVAKGQIFTIVPEPNDRWAKGGGTHKGKFCDYHGYMSKPEWLAMKWKIGASTGVVVSGETVSAPEAGDLYLFCNDDKPALNRGSIRANVSVKPAIATTTTSPKVEDTWVVLFRSVYPSHWNTSVHDASSFAIPLDQAPRNMRYLRIRNSAGECVIIPLAFANLRENVTRDKYGWEGRNYDKSRAFHLGVFDKSLPRAKSGSIDVTQRPGAGFTGYGFGNRVNKDDQQGYVWAGKALEKAGVEIAVTAADLTPAEQQSLLGD
jgi:clan AA aspartic protease (TIGR02281 family)